MKLHQIFLVLVVLLTAVYAQITSSGLTFDGGDVVTLAWALEGDGSTKYDFYLCAGDETTNSYESLARVIKDGTFASGDLVSFRADQNIGGNEPNAYFLKIVSSGSNGSWSGITSHFTLTNMKGSFSAKVLEAIKTMKPAIGLPWSSFGGDHLLEAEVPTSHNASAAEGFLREEVTESVLQFPTPIVESEIERNELRKRQAIGAHTIPYGEQTGPTRYAPVPKRAGTTIADRSATPQYPPFPFSVATEYLPAPTVSTTEMAYLTWTTHSIENTAAPAAAPTLDKRMQRWLERWKD
ncbi:hypothetical protein NUU61_008862 [Penicillium alfredii]|uniref:Yeast cell wall synthesis Kre9/Knh1 C-terminal domain-containing protein n=1 Tax=Penicillium alfredii TaxID=1506179 RepID=A0A9W9JWM3_9EURO|nr:uncharacterized protein NUU61_008862 [Penicillium alfredii]KAJ5084283.1 hypothetical protein NUU61_008862 [Penicillium alfredii]